MVIISNHSEQMTARTQGLHITLNHTHKNKAWQLSPFCPAGQTPNIALRVQVRKIFMLPAGELAVSQALATSSLQCSNLICCDSQYRFKHPCYPTPGEGRPSKPARSLSSTLSPAYARCFL